MKAKMKRRLLKNKILTNDLFDLKGYNAKRLVTSKSFLVKVGM